MQDALRAYLELALGLTEGSRKRAQKVAKDLLGKGEAKASQVQSMAAELLETSRANRETLTRLVRFEVERAMGAVGLATAEEVAELTARVQELERRLRNDANLTGAVVPGRARDADAGDQPAPDAGKSAGKKAASKKATTKKAVAKKTSAAQAPANKAAAKKTSGQPSTAAKATKKAQGRTAGEQPGGGA